VTIVCREGIARVWFTKQLRSADRIIFL